MGLAGRTQLCQGEREGGGGPTEIQLIEDGKEIQGEPRVECTTLHGIQDTANDDDPPAIEQTCVLSNGRLFYLCLLHARLSCFRI